MKVELGEDEIKIGMNIPVNLRGSSKIYYYHLLFKILLCTCTCAEHCDILKQSQKMEQSESESCGNSKFDSSKAVVLYNEDTILPLHKHSRTFKYVSRDIVIKQEWKKLGVAAVVWDAAEVLANYLDKNPDEVRSKRVIELGAGAGLVGIVTALLGGKVTITDREEVIDYLRATVTDNLPLSAMKETRVLPLDWTKATDEFDAPHDVILGADIVYIEEVFEDLIKTLLQLSNAKTVIYLSCRIRYDRDNYFLERLKTYFEVENILYDKEMDVNLYKSIKR